MFLVQRVFLVWELFFNICLSLVIIFWCFYDEFSFLKRYFFLKGKYKWDALHEAGFKKYNQWGSIVKETILPGVNVIWIFNPNDIATVLNDSGVGNYPQRRSHLALEKYRKDRSHVYRTGGLLPT